MNIDQQIEMAKLRSTVSANLRALDAYNEIHDMGAAAREHIAGRVAFEIKSLAQIRRHGNQAKFNKEVAK